MSDQPDTTPCRCLGGSTYGTTDPAVRRCDLCGGVVLTEQTEIPSPREFAPNPAPCRATSNSDQTITPAEIEAGARALAALHFWKDDPWPFSAFSPYQQQDFRDKARAVLEAARAVRHG